MSTAEKRFRYTFDEYLSQEETAEYKSEYYKGEIFAMSGGTAHHSLISTNMTREMGNALMGKDCFVFGSDLKIRIDAADAGVYPDGMVICGPLDYYQDRDDIIANPVVVVEVLSKSTAAWDRGGKFKHYRLLDSLKEYILIEQKVPQIDVFRKNEEGFWVLQEYEGVNSQIEVRSVGVELSTERIYYGVEFSGD